MEELHTRLIEADVPASSALDITLAQKHITRASVKAGEDYTKEIQKAINYLTRSFTGKWVD